MSMKFQYWSLLVIGILVLGCEEEPPVIKFKQKPLLDTTYYGAAPSQQIKKVWLADVTGVRCNNCPRAAELAKKFHEDNPGRIEIIALYPNAGVLTWAWEGYDTLNSSDADQIIGETPGSLPKGMIDKVVYNGSVLVDELAWGSVINQQLQKTTPINLGINTSWIDDEDKGRIEIKAVANTAFNKPVLWIIGILEDKIIGAQSDSRVGGGLDDDYEHNHVLRSVVGSAYGDTIAQKMDVPGYTVERHYFIDRKQNWNADNLSVMVWVIDAETKEILQTRTAKMKP